MSDPWLLLGWTSLAVVALIYVGGLAQWWAEWRPNLGEPRRRIAAAAVLALIWPWAIGAALVRWIKEMA